jgi:(p)ppGpp synthase/HD superfamily hydrolase
MIRKEVEAMLSTDRSILTDRYGRALQWALEKHKLQVRHNTRTPYVSHLLTTSAFVLEEGADEDVAIAALLHDVLEDQPVKVAELRAEFGDRVAQIVFDCTDASIDRRPDTTWRERKLRHLRRMEDFDHDSLLVIAADKVSSLQALVDDLHRFGIGLFVDSEQDSSELMWHYSAACQILEQRLSKNPLVLRLRSLIDTARRFFD